MFHFNTRFNLQEGSSTEDSAINQNIVLIDGGKKRKKLRIVHFLAFELTFYVSLKIESELGLGLCASANLCEKITEIYKTFREKKSSGFGCL